MNITIRRAISGDETVLAELNAFVHELHVANNPAYFKPTIHQEVVAWFQGLLDNPGARIWIAEEDGAAIGYLVARLSERAENVFGRSRRWLEIDQIGVRPNWRRMGVARGLVDVVLQAAESEGIRDVELSSWVFNSEAQEAFRKLGFTPQVVRFALKPAQP